MHTHKLTDTGTKRSTNEDAALTASIEGRHLLVVADGMGGHAAGDVASDIATTTLKTAVERALPTDQAEFEAVLEQAIAEANEEIQSAAAGDSSLSGMGTTVVAAVIDDDKATIANVGDSRCYHIEDGVEQVTVDQSLVQELVAAGEITEAEAKNHPQRNVVSQALGTTENVKPDIYTQTVDGTLLLCSDGLTEEVSDDVIARLVIEKTTLVETAEALIERVNQNGGKDNIAVALFTESETG